jgi:transcriptional regulator with XRE-family HTH domain
MATNIAPMKIGQVIREIREAHKATLEEIAFAADTNASNLSRIERGTQGYSADTLDRIAKALGVTVSDLHLRMEAASRAGNKASRGGGGQKQSLLDPTITSSKYSALTQEHRELVDEFMTMLLRRQRNIRA